LIIYHQHGGCTTFRIIPNIKHLKIRAYLPFMMSGSTLSFHVFNLRSKAFTVSCVRESSTILLSSGSSSPKEDANSSAIFCSLTRAMRRLSNTVAIGRFSRKLTHSFIQLLNRSMFGRRMLTATLFNISGFRRCISDFIPRTDKIAY
jgi:hypothetical protein